MRLRLLLVVPAAAILVSCLAGPPPVTMADLSRDYVYNVLALNPTLATQAGYHTHPGKTLDDKLESFTDVDLNQVRDYLRQFRERLDKTVPDPGRLSAEDRADYDIITQNMALTLFEMDTAQTYKHNPTMYVELIGNSLFSLYTLDFAPLDKRFASIIERISQVPALLGQAQRNLVDSPEIWLQVAAEENDGNLDLITRVLKDACPPARRVDYDRAAGEALSSINQFNQFLKEELSKHPADWRLGKDKYAAKFRSALGLDLTPEQVLADAERELESMRQQMFQIALPLHRKYFPDAASRSDLDTVVGQTLSKIAERHATPATYMADAQRDLDEARQFVRTSKFAALPARDNLKVIDTPEFMRGIYAVGGFNPAPPLEPQLGAFYWLTPIPSTWSKDRIESKLREYNFYGLKLLTIHEAIPGHYLQFEHANNIEPLPRRALREVFGNNPYIEGWAVYSSEAMLDAGYLDNDPELRLSFLKLQLRMVANTILDIRLQTMGMTDQEALDLMMKKTFQEKEEATAKLQRAKLSSTQLCTYFTGWREWKRIRDEMQKKLGSGFNLGAFHDRALEPGAVPMPALERILMSDQ